MAEYFESPSDELHYDDGDPFEELLRKLARLTKRRFHLIEGAKPLIEYLANLHPPDTQLVLQIEGAQHPEPLDTVLDVDPRGHFAFDRQHDSVSATYPYGGSEVKVCVFVR